MAAELSVEEIRKLFPQRSCWVTPGRGGRALVRETMDALGQAGFWVLGTGRIPENVEVVYAPTGSVSQGGPRTRTKYWVGRWVRGIVREALS
jgi:hypothetical protein